MKRVCSIFSQVLQLIPRDRFEAAVGKHHAERHARGFTGLVLAGTERQATRGFTSPFPR